MTELAAVLLQCQSELLWRTYRSSRPSSSTQRQRPSGRRALEEPTLSSAVDAQAMVRMQAEKEALCVAEAQLRADYDVVLTVLSEMPEVVAQDSAPKKQRQSASAQASHFR